MLTVPQLGMSDPKSPYLLCPCSTAHLAPTPSPTTGQVSCRDLGFNRKEMDPGPILWELHPVEAMNIVMML